jgi:hypothetical protein
MPNPAESTHLSLCKIDIKFENFRMIPVTQGGLIDVQTKGRQSRDTVSLNKSCGVIYFFGNLNLGLNYHPLPHPPVST